MGDDIDDFVETMRQDGPRKPPPISNQHGPIRKYVDLIFGMKGRINRQGWWTGTLIYASIMFGVGGLLLTDSDVGWKMLVMLLAWIIFTFLTIKRLRDRDFIWWLAPLLSITTLPLWAISVLLNGFLDDQSEHANVVLVLYMYLSVFYLPFLWLFIDNGFLRGVDGENRYGDLPSSDSYAITGVTVITAVLFFGVIAKEMSKSEFMAGFIRGLRSELSADETTQKTQTAREPNGDNSISELEKILRRQRQ